MEKKRKIEFPAWLRRGILAWLVSSLILYLRLSHTERSLEGTEGLEKMSFLLFLVIWIVVLSLLRAGARILDGHKKQTEKLERWGIFSVSAVLGGISLSASYTLPYLVILLVALGILAVYALRGWIPTDEKETERIREGGRIRKWPVMTVIILSFLFFGFVSAWTVCRVWSFSTPTYDFGIFSQMFARMKETGLPMTTLERDGLLSHFQVHVSPIYYLMLPFYLLFTESETLQILQAAVLTSAVVPLWLLIRKKGMPPAVGVFFSMLLFLYPAFSGGTSYDLHENVFLAPLLLWLFYGIECQKVWVIGTAAVLTLLVKEDAAMYVAVVGLWLLVSGILKKERERRGVATGVVLLAGAVLWFGLVTGYLARYGDGVMTYRYNNFMFGGSASLVTVIEAALMSPMKVLYECVDSEKLPFIALTLIPLLGLPLWTRRYERLILLIPYVLVNLMSDYRYQHDIFFQYTFGSTACLFYLALLNVEDVVKKGHIRIVYGVLLAAALISAYCFGDTAVPKAVHYMEKYRDNQEHYEKLTDLLEKIPGEASVAATSFFTTRLSKREILYDVRYASGEHLLSAEYIVLNPKDMASYGTYAGEDESGYEGLVKLLEEKGYQIWEKMGESVVIYH